MELDANFGGVVIDAADDGHAAIGESDTTNNQGGGLASADENDFLRILGGLAHGIGEDTREQSAHGEKAGGEHGLNKIDRAREGVDFQDPHYQKENQRAYGDGLHDGYCFGDAAKAPPAAVEIEETQAEQADPHQDGHRHDQNVAIGKSEIELEEPGEDHRAEDKKGLESDDEPDSSLQHYSGESF